MGEMSLAIAACAGAIEFAVGVADVVLAMEIVLIWICVVDCMRSWYRVGASQGTGRLASLCVVAFEFLRWGRRPTGTDRGTGIAVAIAASALTPFKKSDCLLDLVAQLLYTCESVNSTTNIK